MNQTVAPIHILRVVCCWLLVLVTLFTSSGCWLTSVFKSPWSRAPEHVLQPGASKADVVAHLNKNISPLMSWKSSNVHILAPGPGGIPMRLTASMAVESPKKFRLMAHSLAGNEVDFGSNSDRFWFWINRNKPRHVFTVAHEELSRAQQRILIPFQPDWLMESLGVIPIDVNNVTIQEDPSQAGIIVLDSKQVTPEGDTVHRLIQVDSRQGRIIAHSLYSAGGQLIAQATLNAYKIEEASGIALPHKIDLSLPQTGLQMTITLGQIDVNPEYIPEKIWQLPEIPNSPVFDLAR